MTPLYLAIGAHESIGIDPDEIRPLLHKVGGELDLVEKVAYLARFLDPQFERLQSITDNAYTGCHAKDIAQPVGAWYVNHFVIEGKLPSVKDALKVSLTLYLEDCELETITLISSHADLLVNRDNGLILSNNQREDSEDSFSDVVAFNPQDLQVESDTMDILDAGFWTLDKKYTSKR